MSESDRDPGSPLVAAGNGAPPVPLFLPGLEPLRAFAAISVLLLHVVVVGPWDAFPRQGPLTWFLWGWLGVDIFFVISGLVVTLAALREFDQAPAGARSRFLLRRAARIVPLYYASLVFFLLFVDAAPVRGTDALFQIATHAALVHNVFLSTTGSINGPSWSIGTEWQLYLCVALALPWLTILRPAALAIAIVIAGPVYRLAAYAFAGDLFPEHAVVMPGHLSLQVPGTIETFGFGVALALLLRRRGVPRIRPGPWLAIFGLAVLGLAGLEQILAIWGGVYWSSWLLPTFFRSISALVCGLLVFACATAPATVLARVPATLTYLGTISYGIYLWHMPLLLLLKRHFGLSEGPLAAALFPLTLVAASASWYLLERPCSDWARRLTRDRLERNGAAAGGQAA